MQGAYQTPPPAVSSRAASAASPSQSLVDRRVALSNSEGSVVALGLRDSTVNCNIRIKSLTLIELKL